MNELISPDDLASTIILMRDVDSRAIILVEGQSDSGVIEGHLDGSVATTVPGHGKRNVCGAIAILLSAGVEGVAGVVDADFWGLVDEPCGALIVTENYDLDADVVRCPGLLARVAGTHFDREALQALVEELPDGELASWILETAGAVGALRLVCHREGLDLRLQKFPIEEVFDVGALTVDVAGLVRLAVKRSEGVDVDVERLQEQVRAELDGIPDVGRLASGHDVCAILALVGRRRLGARGIGREGMERAIRSAVGCAEFGALKVARELTTWGDGLDLWLWDHSAA